MNVCQEYITGMVEFDCIQSVNWFKLATLFDYN